MTFTFQHHHGAMLLKYSGISFISGAVNHGFFSGERSLWTAAVGIVLFVLGAALEHRLSQARQEPLGSLSRTLVLGAFLSVGLGFFTGGLQHFPDSPARSAWVVPLGFFISVLALALNRLYPWRASSTAYTVALGLAITAGSHGAWQWLQSHPQYQDTHRHDAPQAPATPSLQALRIHRSIEVRMDDTMRFTPDTLHVQAGETVRLVVHNTGQVEHELVLGSETDIRNHAQAMQQGAAHGHGHGEGAAITLAPGQSGEMVVQFARAGELQMACLIPGHYDAGMRGQVKVSAGAVAAPAPHAPNAPTHDHSAHKH